MKNPTTSKDFGYELFQVLSILFCAILLYFILGCSTAEAGERRMLRVDENGKHFTVAEPGECYETGCVMYEKYVEEWTGEHWIHQFIDNNEDGVCDIILVWKPIVDPRFGVFYGVQRKEKCSGAL